jgi:hypothetical protein
VEEVAARVSIGAGRKKTLYHVEKDWPHSEYAWACCIYIPRSACVQIAYHVYIMPYYT